MDRLAELSRDLTVLLTELRTEANRRDLTQLAAPLSWLDEANGWLNYELVRIHTPSMREPVMFSFVPTHLRK
ncbi:MAG: hypothetical protein M3P30_06640 [Chloroflexota bacterium]|nr:hypothetical protein [Chloroflexota bacterium]